LEEHKIQATGVICQNKPAKCPVENAKTLEKKPMTNEQVMMVI